MCVTRSDVQEHAGKLDYLMSLRAKWAVLLLTSFNNNPACLGLGINQLAPDQEFEKQMQEVSRTSLSKATNNYLQSALHISIITTVIAMMDLIESKHVYYKECVVALLQELLIALSTIVALKAICYIVLVATCYGCYNVIFGVAIFRFTLLPTALHSRARVKRGTIRSSWPKPFVQCVCWNVDIKRIKLQRMFVTCSFKGSLLLLECRFS